MTRVISLNPCFLAFLILFLDHYIALVHTKPNNPWLPIFMNLLIHFSIPYPSINTIKTRKHKTHTFLDSQHPASLYLVHILSYFPFLDWPIHPPGYNTYLLDFDLGGLVNWPHRIDGLCLYHVTHLAMSLYHTICFGSVFLNVPLKTAYYGQNTWQQKPLFEPSDKHLSSGPAKALSHPAQQAFSYICRRTRSVYLKTQVRC